MKQILPGNAISLVAAAFIAASCCMHGTRKASLLQIGANLVLALSSVVLGAWSGLVTLLLSSLRMLPILYNTYNRRQMAVFCVLTVAVGLWGNTRGLWGFCPSWPPCSSPCKATSRTTCIPSSEASRETSYWGQFIARSS